MLGQKRKESLIPSPVDPKKRKSVMPEWSDLPQDLVASIAKRIVSLEDFYVFGAVSRSCKSAATKSNFTGELTHQVPLVLQFRFPRQKTTYDVFVKVNAHGEIESMERRRKDEAAEKQDERDAMIQLYSLTKDRIYRFNWPPPELTKSKVCNSSLGWLLTAFEIPNKRSKYDLLLNPFNNAKIELPDGPRNNMNVIMQFVLSSSPSSTLDFTVMITDSYFLYYCRPGLGQGRWFKWALSERRVIDDLNYFKGRYYLVDHLGCVLVAADIHENPRMEKVAPEIPSEVLGPMMHVHTSYLVESAGDLLVVLCLAHKKNDSIVGFRVFKVPFSKGNSWSDSEIKNLGNRTLFLCQQSSCFSIEASDSSKCKANCIYFIHHCKRDAGIYNMEDGTIDRDLKKSFQNFETSFGDDRLWIQPSFNDAQCAGLLPTCTIKNGCAVLD